MSHILILLLEAVAGGLFALATRSLWAGRGGRGRPGAWVTWVAALGLVLLPLALWSPRVLQPEGRLRVLSVLDEETTNALIEAFERETGVLCDVDPFSGGAGRTAGLLLEQRLQPDVFIGGTVEIHDELGDAGLLRAVSMGTDVGRIDTYDDPKHRWTPIYIGFLALIHRPLPELRRQPPQWNTLLEPRYENRITIPSPTSSGGGLVFLATQLMRQRDAERGWEFLRLLREHGARFETRSEDAITQVAAGSMDLGVAWAHDVWRRRELQRIPVEISIPEQTGYEVGGVSVLRWVEDPAAADRFVHFLTGPTAARIQATTGYRVPLRTDVDPPLYLGASAPSPADDLSFYDRGRVLAERDAWLDRWRTMTAEAR